MREIDLSPTERDVLNRWRYNYDALNALQDELAEYTTEEMISLETIEELLFILDEAGLLRHAKEEDPK